MGGTNRERLFAALFVVGCILSLLGAAALISQRQMRLHGAVDGLPELESPQRVPVLGINVELRQYDDDELEENLDLIADQGFVWVRQVFDWSQIAENRGAYDWEPYDRIVEEADKRDLRIVAVLWGTPLWMSDLPSAPPRDREVFEEFAALVAERYGDSIDVYQIWDEPNLWSGWGEQPPDPVSYAALLESAYDAIHSSDANAMVLTAGLAPTNETGPQNLNEVLYLRALYDNGAAPFFDGVAGKPYGFDDSPEDRRVDQNRLNFSRFILLRDEMVRAGDGGKPLWASNFGWNALPEGWEGAPSAWGLTTPHLQSERTLAAYERALLEWPWSGGLILENWQPDAPEDDPHWGFALRGQDGALSPTAEAIAAQADLVNTALWPGIYAPQSVGAEYYGDWEFSELGADFSETEDSIVDVTFAGDQLATIIRRDNYRAYLYVEVDGQPSRVLPRDENGAYLVLTSPDYRPRIEALSVADGLIPGERHVAHIEATRGWDQWALVGFAVGHSINTLAYDLGAGGLTILAVVLAILASRRIRVLSMESPMARFAEWLPNRLSATLHLMLSLIAALALWLGAALTWGGLVPNLVRRWGDGPSLLITALTAGVFYFSPWLILTLVALLVLFLLIYARPQIGVALVMFFTPYYFHPRPLFDRAFSMVEITSLLTLMAWTIHIIAERKEKGWPSLAGVWKQMTALDKGVAAFVALSAAALGWSELMGVAFTELRQMVLEPVVVYLVLRTLPFSKDDRWRVVDMLTLTGVVVAGIGLYQLVSGANLITAEGGIPRLRSVYNSPNSVALFLGRVIPPATACALIGGQKGRRRAYGIAGVLMLSAAGLSLSKGGLLLGLPAGLAMVVIVWAGRRGLIAVGLGVLLEVAALIPLSRIPRFQGLFDLTSGTSTSFFRVKLWQSTFQMLRDQPLTGVGLDQFLYEYRGHYILPSAWQEPDLSTPHNFLLSYWVRVGVLGLAVGVWLQVTFWRTSKRLISILRGMDLETKALVAGLMGGMAAFVAHGLVDEAYYLIDLAFVFFMTLGLLGQIAKEVDDGTDSQGADATLS